MRGVVVIFWVLAMARFAAADDIDTSKAEADKLFFEGRALLEAGKNGEACVKFDQAFKKDPYAIGILLNLGLCKETIGQVATAYRLFAEARQRAKDQSLPEYLEAIDRRLALIAPRVPHVKITFAERVADMRVLVDDVVHDLDQDIVLDPGKHTIVVTARERLPFSTTIEIKESERKTVTVPPLEGVRIVVRNIDRRRTIGKIVVGAGGVLVVTSVVLGYFARERYWDEFPSASRDGQAAQDAEHDCWTIPTGGEVARRCNADGAAALDSARLMAHIGTGVGVAGVLAIGGGLALWLTAPKDQAPVAVHVTPEYAGVAVTRSF